MDIAIFGAKSIALGVYYAVSTLYAEYNVKAFFVSSNMGNPENLAGLPVLESATYMNKDICVLIAVPENIHPEIIEILEKQGFHNYICIDSKKEAFLMEQYFDKAGKFASIHML